MSDLINDLGFVVEHHTNGPGGFTVACLRDAAGRVRRASAEEEKLWAALEEMAAKLGEAEPGGEGEGHGQRRRGGRGR